MIPSVLEAEDRTYNYQCRNCETEFESPHSDMSQVSCPDCSSTRIASIGVE